MATRTLIRTFEDNGSNRENGRGARAYVELRDATDGRVVRSFPPTGPCPNTETAMRVAEAVARVTTSIEQRSATMDNAAVGEMSPEVEGGAAPPAVEEGGAAPPAVDERSEDRREFTPWWDRPHPVRAERSDEEEFCVPRARRFDDIPTFADPDLVDTYAQLAMSEDGLLATAGLHQLRYLTVHGIDAVLSCEGLLHNLVETFVSPTTPIFMQECVWAILGCVAWSCDAPVVLNHVPNIVETAIIACCGTVHDSIVYGTGFFLANMVACDRSAPFMFNIMGFATAIGRFTALTGDPWLLHSVYGMGVSHGDVDLLRFNVHQTMQLQRDGHLPTCALLRRQITELCGAEDDYVAHAMQHFFLEHLMASTVEDDDTTSDLIRECLTGERAVALRRWMVSRGESVGEEETCSDDEASSSDAE